MRTHLANFQWLQRTQEQFRSAGRDADFRKIVAAQLPLLLRAPARASAHWILGDVEAAAEDLASDRKPDPFVLSAWKERFRAKGTPEYRTLLEKLLAANPEHAADIRLELLEIAGSQEDDRAIREMEALLASGMPTSYEGFKSPRVRTAFDTVYDLAYRVARIYERSHDFEKLTDLGLRIARGDSPFRQGFDVPAAHQTVALALQYAPSAELESRFAPALTAAQWTPERAQLERRKNVSRVPVHGGDFGWSEKLPPGVRLLASNEDVLALSSDKGHVYTGHPWGIAVYDHAGNPVTRVAIGHPVLALAAVGNAIWAGTTKGLFRVGLPAFDVSKVGSTYMDGVIPELGVHADSLWIGGRNLARLNLKTRELRLFAPEETGAEPDDAPPAMFHAGAWGHFVFDGPLRVGERQVWCVPSGHPQGNLGGAV